MKYIIIGGGISGLYTAYSLHKQFGIKDIIVIEQSNRLGGRIYTKYLDKNTFIEMGAGGVVNVQTNILALLDELGINTKFNTTANKKVYAEISVLPTSDYIPDEKLIPTIYRIDKYVPLLDTDFYNIINDLYSRLADYNFRIMAQNYSLYYLIEKYYGPDKAKLMSYQHGYHGELYAYNAIDALVMFKTSFSPDSQFTRINGGMSEIIKRLAKYLKNNNIPIKLNHKCHDIIRDSNNNYQCILQSGEIIYADNIVLTMPKKNMLEINYLQKIKTKLDSVENKELLRIYAIFPVINRKVWFDELTTTTSTSTLLNQLIPINKDKGILMVYCDTHSARTWYDFHQQNVLERELQFHLQKLFSHIEIPKPNKLYVSFYESATHVWRPTVNSAEMYNDLRQPIKDENIFIVGETYSIVQQWSEGAVKSVNDLMILLKQLNNY